MSAANSDRWWLAPAKAIDQTSKNAARAHQNRLTKPPGSLGELEDIAVRFAAWQGTLTPVIDSIRVRVFAADHGVCARGVSAFPQIVTTQMIQNFAAGGAAISVLSRQLGADFAVVNLGTAHPLADAEGVQRDIVGNGTRDFSAQAAMSAAQCERALSVGRRATAACDLFIGGEMGIGNTTSAAAIYSALLGLAPEAAVGRGTGIDDDAMARKIAVVTGALALHRKQMTDAVAVLRCLGGFEIAALTGAYIANAQRGVPNLIDGFISTAAAMLAVKINPSVGGWCLLSHLSAEPAHRRALHLFTSKPLLDAGLRLGEGSGAALTVPLLRAAVALHNHMATFAAAGVSDSGEVSR